MEIWEKIMFKIVSYQKLISVITLSAMGLALFKPAETQSWQTQSAVVPAAQQFSPLAQSQPPPNLGLFNPLAIDVGTFFGVTIYSSLDKRG
ncbi:MAG: hypothetical protein HC853_07255 [Anaerolineae bacterium]|nr:hypothetical protein [Anaerolineae bacterium]